MERLKKLSKTIVNYSLKLIPAGTGVKDYKNVEYQLKSELMDDNEEVLEKLEDELMD